MRRLRLLSLALVPVAGLLWACAVNPATGQRQVMLVSESQEIAMGQQSYQQTLEQTGAVEDEGLQAYVRGIGMRMAAISERPDLPWTFTVLDDAVINAYAAPGGYIFLTRGILTYLGSEAELASVLGHEIGHVTARHSAAQVSRQQLAQIGLMGAMIASPDLAQLAGALNQGLGLLFLKWGRDQESQSDELGFRYMMRTEYDPREADDMFQVLLRVGEGSDRLPSWASTHPFPEDRIAQARQRVDTLSASLDGFRVGREAYLRQIEGLTFGENPRHGYFEQNRFYHPDMAFQFDVPEGWQRLNTRSSVMAAPQDGSAVFQLQLAEGGARTAAQQFFGNEAVQGQAEQTTINGLPAAGGNFTAQTEQGAVEGVAAFIEHKGRTFRLLGYGATGIMQQQGTALNGIVRSFRPVTDRAVLGKQPSTLALVTAPAQMTLEEFNRRYPSTIPMDQLAIINELDGPASVISKGDLVKRVVE